VWCGGLAVKPLVRMPSNNAAALRVIIHAFRQISLLQRHVSLFAKSCLQRLQIRRRELISRIKFVATAVYSCSECIQSMSFRDTRFAVHYSAVIIDQRVATYAKERCAISVDARVSARANNNRS